MLSPLQMTRSSPKTSPHKSGSSPVRPAKRRARSGFQVFCHSFKQKYENERNAAVIKYNLTDTDNLGVLEREAWNELDVRTRNKFVAIADEEKPPKSPSSNRFKAWVSEGKLDIHGNEINPPMFNDSLLAEI